MIREVINNIGHTYQSNSEEYSIEHFDGSVRTNPYDNNRYLISYNINENYFYQFPQNIVTNNELTIGVYNDVYCIDSTEWKTWEIIGLCHLLDLNEIAMVLPMSHTIVYTGPLYDFDLNFIEENNIHWVYEPRSGGTIVYTPGDVIMSSAYKGNILPRFTNLKNDIINWFNSKGIEAELRGNDILIDDKKVCSFLSEQGQNEYSDVSYIGFGFYVNTDLELIQQICLKPMEKIPGRLIDYGITTEEIIEWAQNWLINNPE